MREWFSGLRAQKFSPVSFYRTSPSQCRCLASPSNQIHSSLDLCLIEYRRYVFAVICSTGKVTDSIFSVFTTICHSGYIVLYLPLHTSRKIFNTLILHYHPSKKLSPLTSASMHIVDFVFFLIYGHLLDISLT